MDSKGENKNFPLCCFYCNSEIRAIINGWQLCSGDFALLCVTCGSAYEDGSFCARFHRKENGWTDCVYCGKMLHSGCIMSLKDIIFMDFGGFCCLDCEKKHPIGAVKMPVNDWPDLRYNSGSQSEDYNPKDNLSTIHQEPMTGIQLDIPESSCKGETSAMGEYSIGSSSSGIEADRTKNSEKEIIVYTRRKKLPKNNLKVYIRRNKSG